MYLSQKTFGLIFAAVTIVVVGWLIVANLSKPQDSTNLNPSPSGLLFTNSTSQPPAKAQESQLPASTSQHKQYPNAPAPLSPSELQNKKGVIVTNKGKIEFEIFADTPVASSNFIFLSNEHFYDGLKFHRVVPNFVIQGGDPLGTGQGGPGYNVKETNIKGKYDKGIVAWAKTQVDPSGTAGSQFFIMLANTSLPPDYASFGQVISGQEVVDQIQVGDVMQSVRIEPLK